MCFTKLLASKNLMARGGGGSITIFFQNCFCLTSPKNFVKEPFRVSLISGIEKICGKHGEGVSRFSVESFLSHSAENLCRGDSFSVALFSITENFRI